MTPPPCFNLKRQALSYWERQTATNLQWAAPTRILHTVPYGIQFHSIVFPEAPVVAPLRLSPPVWPWRLWEPIPEAPFVNPVLGAVYQPWCPHTVAYREW